MTHPVLAIHSGYGVMAKLDLSQGDLAASRTDPAAPRAGWQPLSPCGSAVDGVEAALVVMEDSPQFNVGDGANLNAGGIHEFDASIMCGADLRAGAINLLRRDRNPIRAAGAPPEQGGLVMLGGAEADKLAGPSCLDMVEQSCFTTERRVQALQSFKANALEGTLDVATDAEKHGTVDATALSRAGHLAAGTFTGGDNNKPKGRIGGSPIVGDGTYACDEVCPVSGTNDGEFFIRHATSQEIAPHIAYLGEPLAAADDQVIKTDLASSGIVAVDAHANITAPFNTDGIFRSWIDADGNLFVGTHAEVRADSL